MANTVSVDFTDVESGGGFVRVPEGDYLLKVVKVVKKAGEKGDYLKFSIKITDGDPKGINKVINHVCSLTKNSLWNLRNLLEAAGKTVASKAIKIDLDKLVGITMGGTVIDDEPYQGKRKSIITAFFPVAEFGASSKEKEDEEDGSEENGSDESTSDDDEAEELFE